MNAVTRRERKTETRSRKLGRVTKDPTVLIAKYSSRNSTSSSRRSKLLSQSIKYMSATV